MSAMLAIEHMLAIKHILAIEHTLAIDPMQALLGDRPGLRSTGVIGSPGMDEV